MLIPELIPFRLTPQFVHLMTPLGLLGKMNKCMEHSLRVFRQNKHQLIACMQVFTKDPTIDWQLASRRHGKINPESVTELEDPKQRINSAIRKLNGDNPLHIALQDMQNGLVKK